jgi:hypothetical protein
MHLDWEVCLDLEILTPDFERFSAAETSQNTPIKCLASLGRPQRLVRPSEH